MAENEQNESVDDRLNRLELVLSWLLLESKVPRSSVRKAFSDLLSRYDVDSAAELLGNELEYRSDGERISQLEKEVERLRALTEHTTNMFKTVDAQLMALDQRSNEASGRLREIERDLSPWLAAMSLGLETSELRLTRYLPVRMYAAEANRDSLQSAKVELRQLLSTAGFTVATELPDETGSIFSRFWEKTKDACSQPEVAQRLEKIERALQLQGLDKPQAEVDALYLNAAASFLKSTECVPTIAAQVGPLLVVKVTDANGAQVQVKKLSTDQLIALEKNQGWLTSPSDILAKLNAETSPSYSMLKPTLPPKLGLTDSSDDTPPNDETDDDPPAGLLPPA